MRIRTIKRDMEIDPRILGEAKALPPSGVVLRQPRQRRDTAGVPPATVVVDGGGPILLHAKVVLVFWDCFSISHWSTAAVKPRDVMDAAARIFGSNYMSGLAQYR